MTITDAQALVAVELAKHNPDALAKVCDLIEADQPEPPPLADAALHYARAGIACFPLVPGTKVPRIPTGFKGASTDPEMVTAWWARWPDANIGLPTGHLFDCIDVDGPAGYRSLLQLRDARAVPKVLGKVLTSRLGQHLYVPPTGDGNAAGVLPGIDYRGAGGYVVAPPSISGDTGRRWAWVDELTL